MRYIGYVRRHGTTATGAPIVGTVEVAENIWQEAGWAWLEDNIPVGDPAGYTSEAEAVQAVYDRLYEPWGRTKRP